MDFTGKPMKGYVFVDPEGIDEDRDLESWIAMARRFVEAMPSKDTKPLRRRGPRA